MSLGTKALFPMQMGSNEKIDNIIRELKKRLELKSMTYQDLFYSLDGDKDGFITIQEFSEGIEKIMKLSQPAKDYFFSFMDRQKIGMVDLKGFLKAMRKSLITKEVQVTDDNLNWEMDMIIRIREWFAKEKLTVEDAFRTIDKHYKGII